MSLPNELHPLQLGAGSAAAYEIEQSLRFNKADTPYLNKVFTTVGDEQKFTISFWFKTTNVGNSTASNLVGAGYDGNNYFNIDIEKASVGEFLNIFNYTPGTGYEFQLKTTRLLRDPSAWMHLVLAVDTTQATASDRAKVWLNGVRETSFTTENYPNQNRTTMWWGGNTSNGIGLASQETAIGRRPPGGPEYANAYIAEFNSIDGQYLTHEDFGEFDNNGVWRPIEYTGTYTGNSFYLKFDAADVDGDSSGLGNDFTANNFTTSGAGTDVFNDTPTNNWVTWNSVYKDYKGSYIPTYSEGNLSGDTAGQSSHFFATQAIEPGDTNGYYFEVTADSIDINRTYIGLIDASGYSSNTEANAASYQYDYKAILANTGNYFDYANGTGGSNSQSISGGGYSNGDTIMVAYKNGSIWFGKNGTWLESGNPGAGTNAIATDIDTSIAWSPYAGYNSSFTANFGGSANGFQYTVPTGFVALNTANRPAPTVKDGSDYFNTIIYQGASPSDKAVTGVGFQPDFTWIKARTQAYSHALYDAVRGATKELHSDTTDQEDTDTNGLKSFDSDGFTVGSDGEVGDPTGTRVAWNWKANGSGSSNTDGTITSTVSANPTAGFSIISFTGTGNAGSIGHGLGVKPGFVIGKDRDRDVDWKIYFPILGNYVEFTTAAQSSVSNAFTGATSSVLNLQGSGYGLNYSGDKSIVYCFAEVEGYSKFGRYTGNASTDGPFVYCGFTPQWILLRPVSADYWMIFDTARTTYNPVEYGLFPNDSIQETYSTSYTTDLLSNGFKLRTSAWPNRSNTTIIFAAFAENPFGGSNVSPATAR